MTGARVCLLGPLVTPIASTRRLVSDWRASGSLGLSVIARRVCSLRALVLELRGRLPRGPARDDAGASASARLQWTLGGRADYALTRLALCCAGPGVAEREQSAKVA
ncbi:hypothetical protein GY45DRAFT_168693 [Cubamyces sp. BRFM 1775]|nr:hypothetical protein GY45DRAFT_168693 [Cubamyces sp. BRFM 1775]